MKVIGRGGFGRVWKVEMKKNNLIMAMKIMSKVKVYEKNSISNVINEKDLLIKVDYP
jgi:serine/threonine protein kinase